MKLTRALRLLPAAAALLAAIDVGGLVLVAVGARTRPRAEDVAARPSRGSPAPPEGYLLGGRLLVPPGNEPCWAVRFEASSCAYCSEDDNHGWRQLAGVLEARHCKVFFLPPGPSRALLPSRILPPGAAQELFVNMAFLKHFRLTYTPSTLVFGPGDALLWSQQSAIRRGEVAIVAHDLDGALGAAQGVH